jgi:cell pole-organizing protein PopZ
MEDILASIRRILNEDDAPPGGASPAEAPAEEDVLVLDQSMMVKAAEAAPDPFDSLPDPEPPPPPQPEAATQADIDAMDFDPPPQVAAAAELPQPAPAADPPLQPAALDPQASMAELVGAEAAAAAALSVGNLVRTLSAGRAMHVYSGGPTLEDLVRSELRPLLKEWLDSYLPPMVERLVSAEIERVVGRAVL